MDFIIDYKVLTFQNLYITQTTFSSKNVSLNFKNVNLIFQTLKCGSTPFRIR